MPCDYRLARPTTYTVQYLCACGWASDEVPSDQLARIGVQLIDHGKERRWPGDRT